MRYVRLLIGDHTLPMLVDPQNSDVVLMYARGDEIGPYSVRLPETDEMAEALGRLIFRGPRYKPPIDPDLIETLMRRVDSLELGGRALGGIQNMGIEYIWQLVERSPRELLATKNFGRRSLGKIREILENMNLALDMRIGDNVKEIILKSYVTT